MEKERDDKYVDMLLGRKEMEGKGKREGGKKDGENVRRREEERVREI